MADSTEERRYARLRRSLARIDPRLHVALGYHMLTVESEWKSACACVERTQRELEEARKAYDDAFHEATALERRRQEYAAALGVPDNLRTTLLRAKDGKIQVRRLLDKHGNMTQEAQRHNELYHSGYTARCVRDQPSELTPLGELALDALRSHLKEEQRRKRKRKKP